MLARETGDSSPQAERSETVIADMCAQWYLYNDSTIIPCSVLVSDTTPSKT